MIKVPTPKLHAQLVGIVRASTLQQSESTATQKRKIIEYAQRMDMRLACDPLEAVQSGKLINRDSVEHALDLIRRKKATGIIVTRLDRLARNLRELLRIAHELRELDAALICTEQNIDTRTAEGRLFFHMMGALAEFERELIKDRVLEGKEQAKLQGRFMGGAVPIGFETYTGTDKKVYLRPAKKDQKIIAEIVRLRDEEGLSFQDIADKLTSSKKTWHITQVRRLYTRAKETV